MKLLKYESFLETMQFSVLTNYNKNKLQYEIIKI